MPPGIRTKAVPYYACFIADQIAKKSSCTPESLRLASHREDSDFYEYFILEDKQIIDAALKFLRMEGLIELVPDEFGPDIVVKGNDYFSNLTRLFEGGEPTFAKFSLSGGNPDNWLIPAILKINLQLEKERANNADTDTTASESLDTDTWSPLPIERHDGNYISAVDAAEKAMKAIEQNNGYAASEPEERNGIVATIKGTLEAIKTGAPSRRAVVEGLLKPLKYIAKKFADSTMGELAKDAVGWLVKWLFLP